MALHHLYGQLLQKIMIWDECPGLYPCYTEPIWNILFVQSFYLQVSLLQWFRISVLVSISVNGIKTQYNIDDIYWNQLIIETMFASYTVGSTFALYFAKYCLISISYLVGSIYAPGFSY